MDPSISTNTNTTNRSKGVKRTIMKRTKSSTMTGVFYFKFLIVFLSFAILTIFLSHRALLQYDFNQNGNDDDGLMPYPESLKKQKKSSSTLSSNVKFINGNDRHISSSSTITSKRNHEIKSFAGRRIPRLIILIDTRYETIYDIPHPLQQNVQHTIQTYLESWDDVNLTPYQQSNTNNQTSSINDESNNSNFVDHFKYMQNLMNSKYVWYLNDQECQRTIEQLQLSSSLSSSLSEGQSKTQIQKILLEYYKQETSGRKKSDICRIAALYQRGGYYFDTDIQVVKPLSIESHITFLSPFEEYSHGNEGLGGMFHSFIAAAPKHPILFETLNMLLENYAQQQQGKKENGTASLYRAVMMHTQMTQATATKLSLGTDQYNPSNLQHNSHTNKDDWPLSFTLAEINLSSSSSNSIYPNFQRHYNGQGCCCHNVVHDILQKQIYFYSRIVGVSDYCTYKYKIPHRLVFLDTRYDSIQNIPSPFQENVLHTIDVYQKAWKEADREDVNKVDYLGEKECQHVIQKVEPRLLKYYQNEQKGQNKANVCRIATLYDAGGYYFDTDMQVVEALSIKHDATFVTPHEAKSTWHDVQGFFNSFVAVMRKHPLLRINLDIFVQYYESHSDATKRRYKGKEFPLLGTASLYASYTEFLRQGSTNNEDDGNKVGFDLKDWLLDLSLVELRLTSDVYKTFPRHKAKGCCCDYVVHNETEKHIYFYSRIIGAEPWCVALS